MKIISTVPKLYFSKQLTCILYTYSLIIQTILKHHRLRIGSEIFILFETILLPLMFDSITFHSNPYFDYSVTFVYFS